MNERRGRHFRERPPNAQIAAAIDWIDPGMSGCTRPHRSAGGSPAGPPAARWQVAQDMLIREVVADMDELTELEQMLGRRTR